MYVAVPVVHRCDLILAVECVVVVSVVRLISRRVVAIRVVLRTCHPVVVRVAERLAGDDIGVLDVSRPGLRNAVSPIVECPIV